MGKLLSGRVGVTTYGDLSTSRYQIVGGEYSFLGLSEVEPNLGLPPNNDQILIGDADGTRRWGSVPPAGAIDGITIQDDGTTPVGFAGSVTVVNFIGETTIVQTKQQIGGVEVGVASITLNPIGLTIKDEGNLVGEVAGISTINFIGSAVTAFTDSGNSGIATVEITGGGLTIQEEGTALEPQGDITIINFEGDGITATSDGQTGIVTVSLDAISGSIDVTDGSSTSTGITTLSMVSGGGLVFVVDPSDVGIATISLATDDDHIVRNLKVTGISTFDDGFISAGSSFTVGTPGSDAMYIAAEAAGTGFIHHENILFLASDTSTDITNYKSNKYSARFLTDGAVELYYNNSKKLETTGSGVIITGVATATTFVGDLTGDVDGNASTATTATNINVAADNSTNSDHYIIFTGTATGGQIPNSDNTLRYNPNKNRLTSTQFVGDLTGDVDGNAGTATTATKINVVADNDTDSDHYIIFTGASTGGQIPNSDSTLKYNPSDNNLTSTNFTGNLIGNADSADAATNIIPVAETSETTAFPLFANNATGEQTPKTNSNFKFDASNGTLESSIIQSANLKGALTGSISTIGDSTIGFLTSTTINNSGMSTFSGFVYIDDNVGIGTTVATDPAHPDNNKILSVGIVTANTFFGDLVGTASSTNNAGTSTKLALVQTNDTNSDHFLLFSDSVSGDEEARTDDALKYNPSDNNLTVDNFTGQLTGNVNGSGISTVGHLNCSGIVTATTKVEVSSEYNIINNQNSAFISSERTFTATANVAVGIDTFRGGGLFIPTFKCCEYTLMLEQGGNIQSQKCLIMTNGSSAYIEEYAIMYQTDKIADFSTSSSNSVTSLVLTPIVDGSLTYRFIRSGIG